MKIFNTLLILAFAAVTISCGDSKHEKLADNFVNALNVDANYDVTLVKTNTLQKDYIVVYDNDLKTYDAYDLAGYVAGDDVVAFLDANEQNFYYNLGPRVETYVTYETHYD